ncbi:Tkp3 protein [Vanderwaltozyma polyspora DSM 70294]|uniref:Tkp3 protein n=1 Tax=Vanderwaltozyma polyspora (strain ATCC 22028 / DSM 70294 / BCRC 21397 / CBS 2163 / NBRC 10782 / NRRL Y-8283 / UCD 57-17) TaxID=436907 RepID=A7TF46_VANPO|nr:Tkp3 protein [Vanderwaltozyma polyspora DSM 70294]EDO19071.1 Tkp3 protein [Vanderwaltozyma polyspora DSM 70294]
MDGDKIMTDAETVSTGETRLQNLEIQMGEFSRDMKEVKANSINNDKRMQEMQSLLEQLTGMFKAQSRTEEIHGKTLEQASIQFSKLQRNEEEMRINLKKDEEEIIGIEENEKQITNRIIEDESKASLMEQRIIQIEERLNNGNPNNTNGFKSRSKLPSQNETLAKVERHFPSLVIYGNHSLVANCTKNYSDVSVPMNNDAILKDEDIEDPLDVLLTIQGLLVGKHVRFQDWGNFLYSCCKKNARSYLTDQRGFIVDWTTAIAKFFQTFDFGARTQSELSELSHFNPKAGDDAREYFVNLVHKGKAIRNIYVRFTL